MSELEEVALSGEEEFGFDPTQVDTFDLGIADVREQEGFTYPAILLSRVLFTDCLKVLQSRKRSSYREMDTWIELPGDEGFQKIGTLQMDSDTLLVLRLLRIGVTMYYSEGELETLDLDDPEVLERFV